MATLTDNTTEDKFLGGQVSLRQPRSGYRAGQDAVFLAAACPAECQQSVLELGCGVGAALVCLGHRTKANVSGVELDASAAELARANTRRNGVDAEVFTADITNLPAELKQRSFDHVILNPPYFGPGSASADPPRDLARREQTPLHDWIDVALTRLVPNGCITLIHLVERLSDIISLLNTRAGRIEIKPISPRPNKVPNRVIIRAKKGSSSATRLYNPLILHEGLHHEQGKKDFTEIAQQVLRNGRSLEF